MKLIKGYQQWLNENFQAIFEDWTIDSTTPSTEGFAIDDAKYDQFLASPGGQLYSSFAGEVAKSNIANLRTKENQQQIFGAIVRHGQTAKKGFLGIFGGKSLEQVVNATLDSLIAGQSKLTYTKSIVDYNIAGTDPTFGFTSGKCSNFGGPILTDSKYQKTNSRISFLLTFCNAYNIKAFETGQGQFILSTRMGPDGYLNLLSAPTIDADNLYLYSQKLLGDKAVGKEVKTDVTQTGGTAGVEGKYAAQFAVGSDQLTDALKAEVAKAVDLCVAKFPAGSRPDKFTLTSGASTEFGTPPNKKQMPKAEGTGPVTPTDDATKNQDLAYRRGVAFMNALNAGLKAKGHPGFDSYEVGWSIGLSGQQENAADRFVDLNIAKNAVKPKATETTTISGTQTGSELTNVRANAQFFELKLTFAAAAAPAK